MQGVGFREATRRRAERLGVMGWVRNADDGSVLVHAEGSREAVQELLDFLGEGPRAARVADVSVEEVRPEGHEQFGIRGVSAGVFVVQEHAASTHHYDLRLEVAGAMRSWAVPKGPSMDPAIKRLAVQVPDHDVGHNDFEGRAESGGVIVWDRGRYEQGGRVRWPEALDRGHAVFVLHGQKLQRRVRAAAHASRAARAVAAAEAAGRVCAPGLRRGWRDAGLGRQRPHARGRAARLAGAPPRCVGAAVSPVRTRPRPPRFQERARLGRWGGSAAQERGCARAQRLRLAARRRTASCLQGRAARTSGARGRPRA